MEKDYENESALCVFGQQLENLGSPRKNGAAYSRNSLRDRRLCIKRRRIVSKSLQRRNNPTSRFLVLLMGFVLVAFQSVLTGG